MARPGVRGLRTLLILLLLFLAAWLPRALALDKFVTADEPGLLFRSTNFYQTLTNRDLANTVVLLGLLLLVLRVYDFTDGSMVSPSDTQHACSGPISLAVQEGSR